MFIEKITICNLFAYYGKVEVEFGRKIEDKNLYCIYGNNGYGKTSFINACKILFIGTGLKETHIPENFKHFASTPTKFIKGDAGYSGILNSNAYHEAKEEFYIIFEGNVQGKQFILKRAWEHVYTPQINEILEFSFGDEIYHDTEAQEKINILLLPTNFVDFFFFNGEEIGEISENLRKGLKDKIEEILKIKPLDIILKEAGKYARELKEQQLNDDKTQEDYRFNNKELENIKEKLESQQKRIKDLESDREDNQSQIQTKIAQRDKLIADTAEERKALYAQRNSSEEELQGYKNKLEDSLKSVIFAGNQELINRLGQELKALQTHSRKEDINTLNRLLPELKQIAQESLQQDLTYQKIQREFEEIGEIFANALEKMPKVLEGKSVYHSQISTANASVLEKAQIRLEKLDLYQKLLSIKELKSHLKDIKVSIDELQVDEYTQSKREELEKEIQELQEQQKSLEEELAEVNAEFKDFSSKKEEIERRIYHLEQRINTKRIDNKLKILNALEKSVNSYKIKLIHKLRAELKERILDKYKILLPNDNIQDLEINEEFEIRLKDTREKLVIIESQSSGQKQILAIAIFWALSELSKSQIPLIIDTPLGRIDSTNRRSIIQNYYAQNLQTIILPTDSEISQREYQYAKPHIARLYKIDNNADRSHATINNATIDEIL